MHDLGRVLRERLSSLLVLLHNEAEYPLQLDESRLTRVHQGIAAPDGWNLRHPGAVVLTIKDNSFNGSPGCWSQGDTEPDALENIAVAIREYLAARDELSSALHTQGGIVRRS